MKKFNFFTREEKKEARKENRKPEVSFSLTIEDENNIKYYAKKFDLFDDFIWLEEQQA